MTKQQVLKDYLSYKATGVKSERKLADLKFLVNDFINTTKKGIDKFEEKDLIDHLNKISERYSVSSLNGIKANLKNFIKWFFIDWSSRFRNLETLCRQQKASATYQPEQMLSKEDIKQLVDGEASIFWKAYFLVLFYSGSRPCEICSLKQKDIEFEDDGAFIKIYSEKNKEYFNKFIPKDVVFYLKQLQTNNSEWVFPSPQKDVETISVKGVYYRLKQLSKRVLGKHINPYLLRHSIATILYNDDKIPDKNDVAQQMGHNKNMEGKYSHLSKDKLRERARKIWIKQPQLTPEEKKKVEELEKEVDDLKSFTQNGFGDIIKIILETSGDNEKFGKLRKEQLLKLQEESNKELENLGVVIQKPKNL